MKSNLDNFYIPAWLERFAILVVIVAFILFGLVVSGKVTTRAKAQGVVENIFTFKANEPIFKSGGGGGSTISQTYIYTFKPTAFNIGDMVTIYNDGKIVYHNGYTPTEAARELWEAISKKFDKECK